MNQKEQLHTIQQLSTKLNILKPTLRFWEKEFEDILLPLRTNGGQRRYAPEHVSVIREIKQLKKAGLSLAKIKRKLRNRYNSDNSNSESTDLLADRVAEVLSGLNLFNFNQHFYLNQFDGLKLKYHPLI